VTIHHHRKELLALDAAFDELHHCQRQSLDSRIFQQFPRYLHRHRRFAIVAPARLDIWDFWIPSTSLE
jgi:hypothetical protein